MKEKINWHQIKCDEIKNILSWIDPYLDPLPYKQDHPLLKFIEPNSHPFAYLDLVGDNQRVALSHLAGTNRFLSQAHTICKRIPKYINIPLQKISFTPSEETGYTRLIISAPSSYGVDGKYPVHLSFIAGSLFEDEHVHGNIYYGMDGKSQQIKVNYWINKSGFFLTYKRINGKQTLFLAEYACSYSGSPGKETIYSL